jgi:methionyl aminopeptidase
MQLPHIPLAGLAAVSGNPHGRPRTDAMIRAPHREAMSVIIKSAEEIEKMRVAGRLAAEVLDYIAPFVKANVTTEELDALCHDYMVNVQKVTPAPLNYAPPGYQPFPKSICTSVNHVVCHGVPGPRKLKPGDILNIDVTVIKDGFHGDTSRMFFVGDPSIQARRLCEITYECMWRGILRVRAGAYLGDIGHAIQTHAEEHGYSVVREFCGHGIGRKFHEEPQVLHYGRPGTGLKLQAGMIFTIEPMINAGKPGIRQLADGWTVVTKDHSLSAQWEHTVLVTEKGFEVLTLSAGAPPPPAS